MTDESPLLSQRQKRHLAIAVDLVAIVVIVGILFGAFLLSREFVQTFRSVIWPLALASILSLTCRPLIVYFRKTLRISKGAAVALLFLIILGLASLILSFILPIIIKQCVELGESVPQLVERGTAFVDTELSGETSGWKKSLNDAINDFKGELQGHIKGVGPYLLEAINRLARLVGNMGLLATNILLVPVYMIFFLIMDLSWERGFRKEFDFLKPQVKEDLIFLGKEFIRNVVAYFRGQLLIAMILAILFSIAFSIAGVQYSVLLGVIVGLLNMVPFLGTIFAVLVVLPLSFFQIDGGTFSLLSAIVALVTVQLIQDYVLTPKIMGKETGLSPMAVIVSLFFWGTAFDGMLGMVLAIPLTAFLIAAWRFVFKRILANQLLD